MRTKTRIGDATEEMTIEDRSIYDLQKIVVRWYCTYVSIDKVVGKESPSSNRTIRWHSLGVFFSFLFTPVCTIVYVE